MELHLQVDDFVLLGAVVIVVGVLTASLAGRLQVPSLLVFLVVGMAVADDGLGWVHFDDPELAQSVSVIALVLILFEGGLSLSWRHTREVIGPSIAMATLGVGVSAAVVAGAAYLLLDVSATTAWLLAAVVASTDAAAVMTVLRKAPVPRRIATLLEVESGFNDPLAVLLTVGILETWQGDASGWGWAWFAISQIGGGAIVGAIVGIGGAWLANRAHLPGAGLFAVLSSGLAGLAYGAATQIGGSGLLAVFLVGMLLGHFMPRHHHAVRTVHEGFAFGAQMTLFLLLGLQVFPSDLDDVLGKGLVLTAVLMLVARPLSALAVLPWFRIDLRSIVFASWAGLRGAVPIVLATYPLTADYPDAQLVFDVVFFVVFVSVAVQGTTITAVAHRLGLAADAVPATATVMGLDNVRADVIELELDDTAAVVGRTLKDVPMPQGIRISVLERGDRTIVPDGDTLLEADDVLVIVADTAAKATAALERWVQG
jgi:cell volume regulation protein A